MPASITPARYDNVAITLHWLIAALVVTNIALGLYFPDLPRSDPGKFFLAQTHKSIGLTVLVLSLLRLGWRLIYKAPPLPASMPFAMRLAAHTSHFLLYVLIVAIPLSGWAMVSSSPLGLPTLYFGWFAWPQLPFMADLPRADKMHLVRTYASIHSFLAWSAIVLVPIHVLAALYHQFVRHDEILPRMIPGLGAAKTDDA